VTVVFGLADDGVRDKVALRGGPMTVKMAFPLPHGLTLVTACGPAAALGTVNVSDIAPFSSALPLATVLLPSHDRVTDWQ
jgi:hypothetical protein